MFFRAYLGWSIENCGSKLFFLSQYLLSFYRNIVSRVNKALTLTVDEI